MKGGGDERGETCVCVCVWGGGGGGGVENRDNCQRCTERLSDGLQWNLS